MTEERKPAFWVVKNADGEYFTAFHLYTRRPCDAWRFPITQRIPAGHGGRIVPVYVTIRKVKRPRKLTELQRNAVADWLEKEADRLFVKNREGNDGRCGIQCCAQTLRAGRAGL